MKSTKTRKLEGAAIYDSGFQSTSRFRAGGAHTDIHFAIGQCYLGAILVAQSERGICAILIGDDPDPDQLVHDLQDQYPKANLIGETDGYEDLYRKRHRSHGKARSRTRPATRYPRNGLPTKGLERVMSDPGGYDCYLHRDREAYW